jgi:hypothetical protein
MAGNGRVKSRAVVITESLFYDSRPKDSDTRFLCYSTLRSITSHLSSPFFLDVLLISATMDKNRRREADAVAMLFLVSSRLAVLLRVYASITDTSSSTPPRPAISDSRKGNYRVWSRGIEPAAERYPIGPLSRLKEKVCAVDRLQTMLK